MTSGRTIALGDWQAVVSAPGFCLGVEENGLALTEIRFLPPCEPRQGESALAREAERQLNAWLQDPTFTFDLPLAPAGTPYRQQVWAQIAAIPLGQTRSYGDLARALGSAPRAVGGACGANPYPVVVPCHRVVASQGGFNAGLGGFNQQKGGFMLEVKRWLLNHEARHLHP